MYGQRFATSCLVFVVMSSSISSYITWSPTPGVNLPLRIAAPSLYGSRRGEMPFTALIGNSFSDRDSNECVSQGPDALQSQQGGITTRGEGPRCYSAGVRGGRAIFSAIL